MTGRQGLVDQMAAGRTVRPEDGNTHVCIPLFPSLPKARGS
jgi:hypothetical protein